MGFKKAKAPNKQRPISPNREMDRTIRHRVEFHREAIALLPKPEDPKPGVAVMLSGKSARVLERSCNCIVSKSKTCPHLLELATIKKYLENTAEYGGWPAAFRSTLWHRLAVFMAEVRRETPENLTMRYMETPDWEMIQVVDADRDTVVIYEGSESDRSRFAERCGMATDDPDLISRSGLLAQLYRLTLTDSERLTLDQGYKTRGMTFQESFWYKLAYHAYREWDSACRLSPSIAERTGAFTVVCHDDAGTVQFRFEVPRKRVKRFIRTFGESLSNDHGVRVVPIPLDLIFNVKLTRDLDLEIDPKLRIIQKNGEFRLLDGIDMKRFQYDDLVFIPELNILADMVEAGTGGTGLKPDAKTIIQRSQVPAFIEKHEQALATECFDLTEKTGGLKILRKCDRIQINLAVLERDWCWLSVDYGYGNLQISLSQILEARRTHQRFIGTVHGWVDCYADGLDGYDILDATATTATGEDPPESVKVSKLDLLRLQAMASVPLHITGSHMAAGKIENLLNTTPPSPLPEITGMRSKLRGYQRRGTEWLWFLNENRFGGLLCDDMGLGKTHQVMALMLAMQCSGDGRDRFLVVCPTTVLSHWEEKIRMYAPTLRTVVYHGGERDLDEATTQSGVLVTSYGILMRDIDSLRKKAFALAVFDEIQYIKNPRTRTYRAAWDIQADFKLGLTGTPIENSLWDLKALMDLTVPRYLGSDDYFNQRYGQEIETHPKQARSRELNRLISPFVLRRLKSSVLHELPAKIEDIRICRLSEDQTKMYRDAVDSRRNGIWEKLSNPRAGIPYIHIFALLTLLKQICDHPALVDGSITDYDACPSGKWEAFKELLAEGLDSGQKIVVYSQFVEMIAIISNHLEGNGIGHVVLTGKSRKRGALVKRFNTDPDCRVFAGSLRAGGVGIDLVAASIVIHYDRWWNAAKEDQATDRVHRIGQNRGVQVFKMVTRGTLEEKISAIIEKKKNLMETVVREDDPNLLKTFTRDELLQLMQPPA